MTEWKACSAPERSPDGDMTWDGDCPACRVVAYSEAVNTRGITYLNQDTGERQTLTQIALNLAAEYDDPDSVLIRRALGHRP